MEEIIQAILNILIHFLSLLFPCLLFLEIEEISSLTPCLIIDKLCVNFKIKSKLLIYIIQINI